MKDSSPSGHQGLHRYHRGAVLPLLRLGLTACGGRPLPQPIPVPPTRLPEGRQHLIDVGRGQQYDANPGASDRTKWAEGIEVTVEPQDGAYRLSVGELGQGRVVAKFINHSDQVVKELALPAGGSSFWVVYRDRGAWYSAFIADSKEQGLDRLAVPTMYHVPTRDWQQSIAQWQLPGVIGDKVPGGGGAPLLLAAGGTPWVTCSSAGCCKPEM